MTINDLERLLDMPRATIRYYEREGLISPPRMENGYRDYSAEDVRALERIRLLRVLDCSVAEIREIKEGRAQMSAVLREKEEAAHRTISEKENVRAICEDICQSGQDFDELDAKKYLAGTWRGEEQTKPVQVPMESVPKVSAWRRFWARMLDWQICTGVWSAFLSFAWPASQLSEGGVSALTSIVAGNVLMILLEPIWLHFCGTTPGKWALGLRVEADGGGKLTLKQARSRTAGVLWHGLCLNIPVLEIRALWKRYRDDRDGVPLYWEDESAVVQKKKGSVAGYIALRALIALVLVCCMGLGRMPVHRGALSPQEFAENYNHMTWVYGVDQAVELMADGTWREKSEYTINVFGDELPVVETETEAGAVVSATMRMRAEAGEEGNMFFLPVGTMQRVAVALACADSAWYREMLLLGSDEMKILQFCEGLDPSGRGTSVELIEGETAQKGLFTHSEVLELQKWEVVYTVKSTDGVYASMGGGMLILPEGEDGVIEMEFTVRMK